MRVAVSGASGFVGRRLLDELERAGDEPIALVRTASGLPNELETGDLSEQRPLAIPACDAVVHLAARVHVMQERERDPLGAFRKVNVEGTRRLLAAAAKASVSRFVLVSTIKVLGEETLPGAPFGPDSPRDPQDPYAISKSEAEDLVIATCEQAGIEWTIVRPVLVYGAGVGGNFVRLIRLVDRGLPLPFGAIANERSLIHVANLAAFLQQATRHSALSRRAVNLAEPPALSTPQLVRELASAMGRPARLFSAPPRMLEAAGRLAGKGEAVRRLTRSLRVDTSEAFCEMRWTPPLSQKDALLETTNNVLRDR